MIASSLSMSMHLKLHQLALHVEDTMWTGVLVIVQAQCDLYFATRSFTATELKDFFDLLAAPKVQKITFQEHDHVTHVGCWRSFPREAELAADSTKRW